MNAEKLLGGLISNFIGSAASSKSSGKRLSSGGQSVMNQISKGVKSPQGILAAVGVAFGAFEAYQHSSKSSDQNGKSAAGATPPPPPSPSGTAVNTPPPLPGTEQEASTPSSPPPVPPPVPSPASNEDSSGDSRNDMAITLLRAMIAAAHADGELDPQEKAQILDKMQQTGMSNDEESFIKDEMANPKSINELTVGVSDPASKRMMFGLSVATIVEDTEAESRYLNNLATALGLSDEDQRSIKANFARKE